MSEEEVRALSARAAAELLEHNPRAVLIDVRSNMEFLFVGHPVGAVHVPWIDEPDWVINPHFVTQVRQVLLGGVCREPDAGCAPVILICRSGKRSLEAGRALLAAGIADVYHVAEGFEGEIDENHHRSSVGGWRFRGLPWEQC
ncbi:rhodanese-like domain-containing protein [Thiohalobacter thiocyanaticus]|uniref:Rhodanese-like domain-containing protein n=1 Tax=Thiohalobacter thiocyanaticus TaxID=585455 RepID=A0A426QJD5_9GAMM|nr:rhodanese-like domain-containing protein [Thiohalobacter thiocyanaticus]RRQ21850.1 rhodanese-like domain-containing protein [Thiohalobacter thiocyanaticus]